MKKDLPTQAPRFEAPKPKRSQEIALGLAGRALGLGKNASAGTVFEAVATDVGGYQPVESMEDEGTTRYRHPAAERTTWRGAPDETVDSATNSVSGYANTRELADHTGNTHLDSATVFTARGDRRTGEKAGTIRGRVAAKLVGHAIKGVGVHSHLK